MLLYNPAAGLHVMETTDANKTHKFFDNWFSAIKTPEGLPRVHDKKLSIVAMCALLELDPASVPASLQTGWSAIVSAIIHVLKSLPEAVESKPGLLDSVSQQSMLTLHISQSERHSRMLSQLLTPPTMTTTQLMASS